MSTELVPAEEAPDLATMKRADVPAIWTDYRAKAEALKKTAETLIVTSVDQKAEMKLARATRLSIKDLRVEIDHKRKELGEEALRRKQKIDSDAKELRDILEPLEARLLEQEKFAERAEEARKAELKAAREKELVAFGVETQFVDLATMPEEAYDKFYESAQAGFRAKVAAEKKAKEEAEAKAKADAEERQRVQAENERLKKEAAERDAKAKAERDAAEAEKLRIQKEHEEATRKAKEIADKAAKEAEKKSKAQEMALQEIQGIQQQVAIARLGRAGVREGGTIECIRETLAETEKWEIDESRFGTLTDTAKAAKESACTGIREMLAAEIKRINHEEEVAKERAAREKLEAEAREREAKIAADKKAVEQAAKKAARAPDKQKVLAFASALIALPTPECTTAEGQVIAGEINDRIDAFAQWLNEKAGAL